MPASSSTRRSHCWPSEKTRCVHVNCEHVTMAVVSKLSWHLCRFKVSFCSYTDSGIVVHSAKKSKGSFLSFQLLCKFFAQAVNIDNEPAAHTLLLQAVLCVTPAMMPLNSHTCHQLVFWSAPTQVPQLEDLSQFLKSRTGWQIQKLTHCSASCAVCDSGDATQLTYVPFWSATQVLQLETLSMMPCNS